MCAHEQGHVRADGVRAPGLNATQRWGMCCWAASDNEGYQQRSSLYKLTFECKYSNSLHIKMAILTLLWPSIPYACVSRHTHLHISDATRRPRSPCIGSRNTEEGRRLRREGHDRHDISMIAMREATIHDSHDSHEHDCPDSCRYM